MSRAILKAKCLLRTVDCRDTSPFNDAPQHLDNMQAESVSPELDKFIDDELVKRRDTCAGQHALVDIQRMIPEIESDIQRLAHVKSVSEYLCMYIDKVF